MLAMDAETVLSLATIGGARAIGLEQKIGSLEAGKQADIIIVDTQKPHLIPMYDEISHIVYAANGSDIRDVVVAGKILIRDRELLTLDMEDILEEAKKIGEKIKSGK
jgi:5-methylthioadenosine/S-adenosylhomocysteine deaminase